MVSMDEFAGAFCFALDPAASVAGLCVRVNVSSYAVSLTILKMMVLKLRKKKEDRFTCQ